MTSGWGVDATVNGSGVVTSGTESADVRKVWGALYTPGIVEGCAVTRSGSDMTYTVASGVVAIKIATKEVVMAPVALTTVTTAAAPVSGSRVDLIYAEQMFPASGSSDVIVRVTSFATLAAVVVPANSVAIRKYTVTAGQTNTNAATLIGDTDYSIPYGASLGVLHKWQNTYSGLLSTSLIREGHGTIYVPTDRRLRFSVSALLYADGASGFDNTKYTEHYFLPSIDDSDILLWSTPGLHQALGTYNFEYYHNVTAGTHTVNLGAGRVVGPGQAATFYGLDSQSFFRKGIYFQVEDAGPII